MKLQMRYRHDFPWKWYRYGISSSEGTFFGRMLQCEGETHESMTCQFHGYETCYSAGLYFGEVFLFLQIAALVFYILCGLMGLGFVTNFVVIIVCLMMDFWIVSHPQQ